MECKANKQKLPKHITAHKDADPGRLSSVIALLNNETMRYTYFNTKHSGEWLRGKVQWLDSGNGFAFHKDYVGKQIVF